VAQLQVKHNLSWIDVTTDWRDELREDEVITEATWTAPLDCPLADPVFTADYTTVRIGETAPYTHYTVVARAVTSMGQALVAEHEVWSWA
jgi:hypothetical protein